MNPSIEEVCDGRDENCDGLIDVGASGTTLWFPGHGFDGTPSGAAIIVPR